MSLELRPVVIRASRKKTVLSAEVAVARLHRHLPRIEGGLFASTAWVDGVLVGVAIASLPKARLARDGFTVEITRVATDGHPNACSRLYGALCRAAGAVGYRRAITYTRLDEPGTSLRAAGFEESGLTREQSWNRPGRARAGERSQVRRWVRVLHEPKCARLSARRAG